jgi:hypothetical protein
MASIMTVDDVEVPTLARVRTASAAVNRPASMNNHAISRSVHAVVSIITTKMPHSTALP